MQKRVVEQGEAERAESSWYLARDGKQFGPLTDRELSLFAEGGNFKEGDFLWTAGLDSWKPADAIFGLASSPETDGADEANGDVDDAPVFVPAPVPSPEADAEMAFEADGGTGDAVFDLESSRDADTDGAVETNGKAADAPVLVPAPAPSPETNAQMAFEADGGTGDAVFTLAPEPEDAAHASPEPHDEAVDALVQALNATGEKPKPTFKERAIAEAKKFAGIALYLWVVFTVLLVHEWVVLSEKGIGFTFYGLAVVNAVILAKIMLLADNARFADRLKGLPLVYPIVYRAVAFTTLLFAAYVVEEMLIGGIAGRGFLASIPDIGGGLMGALGLWLVLCVALIPYFAFREIERAVGPEMFRRLMLGNLPARR